MLNHELLYTEIKPICNFEQFRGVMKSMALKKTPHFRVAMCNEQLDNFQQKDLLKIMEKFNLVDGNSLSKLGENLGLHYAS